MRINVVYFLSHHCWITCLRTPFLVELFWNLKKSCTEPYSFTLKTSIKYKLDIKEIRHFPEVLGETYETSYDRFLFVQIIILIKISTYVEDIISFQIHIQFSYQVGSLTWMNITDSFIEYISKKSQQKQIWVNQNILCVMNNGSIPWLLDDEPIKFHSALLTFNTIVLLEV